MLGSTKVQECITLGLNSAIEEFYPDMDECPVYWAPESYFVFKIVKQLRKSGLDGRNGQVWLELTPEEIAQDTRGEATRGRHHSNIKGPKRFDIVGYRANGTPNFVIEVGISPSRFKARSDIFRIISILKKHQHKDHPVRFGYFSACMRKNEDRVNALLANMSGFRRYGASVQNKITQVFRHGEIYSILTSRVRLTD